METPAQGSSLATAVATLIFTLVVIQLWLLAASLDAVLSGEPGAGAGAVASCVLFAVNALLVGYVVDFDARLRRFQ